MSVIRLANAAKHYKELPHQLAAWNALEETLTPKQLQAPARQDQRPGGWCQPQ
jgi:hypothetical protein